MNKQLMVIFGKWEPEERRREIQSLLSKTTFRLAVEAVRQNQLIHSELAKPRQGAGLASELRKSTEHRAVSAAAAAPAEGGIKW